MRRMIKPLLFAAFVCAIALPSTSLFAGTNSIDSREQRQQLRIVQGVRSGELTAQEVKKLEKREARIRVAEARDRADGKLTAKERTQLEKKLNHAGRDIYRQKHDNQVR